MNARRPLRISLFSLQLNCSHFQNKTWLLGILFIGLLLRIAAVNAFSHIPEGDEEAYLSMAFNLVQGNGIVDSMGNHAMYNVGYPLFVLAPLFAFFGKSILAVRIANILLSELTIVICYFIAKEAGAGRMGRLTAAAIWALYLPASIYTVYIAKENLMIPLMLGVIWCSLRFIKRPSTLLAVSCGILLGLLSLIGNAALSLLASVFLALLFAPIKFSRKLILLVVIFISIFTMASPWLIRNTQVLGAPVLNTNGGFNLYLGNNPTATGMFISIADTPRGSTWERLRKEGEIKASDTLRHDAIAWIKENPRAFVFLALKKAAYFWQPPFHQGKGPASMAETIIRILWAIQFIVLIAASLVSLLSLNPQMRALIFHNGSRDNVARICVLWTAVLGYTAVHMLFYVIFRYREPIMPIVCVLAALSFESLWAAYKKLPMCNRTAHLSY